MTGPSSDDFARQVAERLAPHLPGGLPADYAARAGRFCAELRRVNASINLTGIEDAPGMALRHVLDSLTALPLLPETGSLMDLGSGCGVPGVPLALARPGLAVTLVESRERKAAALAGLVRAAGLAPQVSAAHARGEAWLEGRSVDVVVARAVEDAATLLRRLRPVRRAFGRLVLLKGPGAGDELLALTPAKLGQLGFAAPELHEARLPEGAGTRVLLVFRPL